MRHNVVSMFLLFFCLSTLGVGCVERISERTLPADQKPLETVDTRGLDSDPAKLRAQKLVAAAESLISPIGFFYADEIIDLALKADPTNRQAQFYKAFLAPFMKFRGFLTRIGDGADESLRNALWRDDYRYSSAKGGLKKFLNDPAPPIKTEKDLQAFLIEVMTEQTKLSQFTKSNKSFLTHFSFPLFLDYDGMLYNCSVEKLAPGKYQRFPCPFVLQHKLKMNRADWEVLVQVWTGLKIATLLTTSYEIGGYFRYIEKDLNREFQSDSDVFKFLGGLSTKFGTLHTNHKLTDVLGLASDIYGGFTWLLSVQDLVCDSAKRNGHLFDSRFTCINKTQNYFGEASPVDVNNALAILKSSLGGMGGRLEFLQPKIGNVSGTPITSTTVDILAAFRNPIKDLRQIVPTRFNNCGHSDAFGDPTLGGIFPDKNAADLVMQVRERTCEKF